MNFAQFLTNCRKAGEQQASEALAEDPDDCDYDPIDLARQALRRSISNSHTGYGFRASTLGACLKAATDAFEKRLKVSDQAAT